MAKNNNTIIWVVVGVVVLKFKEPIFEILKMLGLMPKTHEDLTQEEYQDAEAKTDELLTKFPGITFPPSSFYSFAADIKTALDGVNSSSVHDDIVFDIFERLTTPDDVRALNYVWGRRTLSFMGYSAEYTLKAACKDELADNWFLTRTYTNTVLPKFNMAGL